MADEPLTPDEPTLPSADQSASPQSSPSIIGDTIPGGARYFHNLGDEPVWIESRADLKREMEKRGLVHAERATYSTDDQSPWATRTRLKAGRHDPFLGQGTQAAPSKIVLPSAPTLPALPSTMLSYESAAALRAYFGWALKERLEPELYCASCFSGSRDDKAIYRIDEREIQIICRCRILAFFGETPARKVIAPCTRHPPMDGDTVSAVQLSDDAAHVLRQYRRAVLVPLGLQEALRCNVCYDTHGSDQDGCKAQVLSSSIVIQCRCSRRTYYGMTI